MHKKTKKQQSKPRDIVAKFPKTNERQLFFAHFQKIVVKANLMPKKQAILLAPFIVLSFFAFIPLTEGLPIAKDFGGVVSERKIEDWSAMAVSGQIFSTINSDEARGLYVTMGTMGQRQKMEDLLKIIESTDINSLVIDFKGSHGELLPEALTTAQTEGEERVKEMVKKLHDKNVYLIARIVVFQDSGYAKERPDTALKYRNGSLWRDRRGFAWLDPASKQGWDHIIEVAKEAIDFGFDEIQYDYIRFPTDGDLGAIVYPVWDEKKPRNEILREFFAYSRENLKKYDSRVKLSLDIFGYTFLRNDDLGIGQILSDAMEYFDYVSPMVYPSHYSAGNFGFENPAEHPYEVVFGTLDSGLQSLDNSDNISLRKKVRPWLQVFDMGARYDAQKIKQQIQATYDVGAMGWLLWDPRNNYRDVEEAMSSAIK